MNMQRYWLFKYESRRHNGYAYSSGWVSGWVMVGCWGECWGGCWFLKPPVNKGILSHLGWVLTTLALFLWNPFLVHSNAFEIHSNALLCSFKRLSCLLKKQFVSLKKEIPTCSPYFFLCLCKYFSKALQIFSKASPLLPRASAFILDSLRIYITFPLNLYYFLLQSILVSKCKHYTCNTIKSSLIYIFTAKFNVK